MQIDNILHVEVQGELVLNVVWEIGNPSRHVTTWCLEDNALTVEGDRR